MAVGARAESMEEQRTGLSQLAAFAASVDARAIPAEVTQTAKACLLYGLAVGVATTQGAMSRAACALLDAEGGPAGPATRLLDGKPATVDGAALANAVLLSGRAQGDSHPVGHIGGVVIPAALALAEQHRLTGAALLSTLVAGYEVALRIGRDHAPALTRRGFRTTPCYGVFGAAAATARALGLGAQGMETAVSLASNLAGGLREYVNAGTDESPLQAGFAARGGVSAGLLAGGGWLPRAASTALSGDAGFFTAYGGAASKHGARLCDGLGETFEFLAVTIKPYPACQFLRGAIRGIVDLRQQAGGRTATHISIRLCPFEADFIGVRYAGPFSSAAQTVMSAPFCAALAWTTGHVGYAGMRDFSDRDVVALTSRVTVEADPDLERYQTRISIRLDDGSELMEENRAGDSAYRARWDLAVRAAHDLCAEAGVTADDLIAAVAEIDHASDVRRLIASVREAATATAG